MIFTGEQISADTAERWGLVNEVVPAAALRDSVTALAEKICAQRAGRGPDSQTIDRTPFRSDPRIPGLRR